MSKLKRMITVFREDVRNAGSCNVCLTRTGAVNVVRSGCRETRYCDECARELRKQLKETMR